MPDPVPPPAGGAPPAPEPPATPSQADLLFDGLQNLDRRAETLGQVIRPGQDIPPGMTWDQVQALAWQQHQQNLQPQPPPDPFEETYGPAEPQFLGYDPNTGQPLFDQPQAQGFDPRSLAPVFDSYTEQAKAEAVKAALGAVAEQFQGQALQSGVYEAAQKLNLTDYDRKIVKHLAEEAIKQYPNRAPADLAHDVAKEYLDNQNLRQVQQGGAPVAGSPGPGGPIPGEEVPKTWDEAIARGQRILGQP